MAITIEPGFGLTLAAHNHDDRYYTESEADALLTLCVSDTDLAAWVGTANITTLGAIGTGSWHGTTIAVDHGGTGATTAALAATALGLGTENSPTFTGLTVGTLGGVIKGTAGAVSAITNTTAADYMGGDAAYHTLNQAAIPELTTASGPTFDHVHLTSGQVGFPATQVTSADANTLDDYEEGTWTGELRGSTAQATTPVTATGVYTKIGRQITATIYFSNVDTTGATGDMQVVGLPVASAATYTYVGSVMTYGLNIPGLYNVPYIANASTTVSFLSPVDNGAWLVPSITAGATKFMRLTITYFTA